jgi:hypothetical protein
MMEAAWQYLQRAGTNTCDNDCTAGCNPYRSAHCTNDRQRNGCVPCTNQCVNGGNAQRFSSPSYRCFSGAARIATAIQRDGPVQVCYQVYENFISFFNTNPGGIYGQVGGRFLGNHCVRITGWGTNPNGTPYWIVANSMGRRWGNNGWFLMLRGYNLAGFEYMACAGCPSGRNCVSPEGEPEIFTEPLVGGNWANVEIDANIIQDASKYLDSEHLTYLGHELVSAETQIVSGVHIKLVVKIQDKFHEILILKSLEGPHYLKYGKPLK